MYRSKWNKLARAIRVARRLYLQFGYESAYRRYLWLVDRGSRLVRHSSTPCLAVQCTRVRGYLLMKSMGYRTLRAA